MQALIMKFKLEKVTLKMEHLLGLTLIVNLMLQEIGSAKQLLMTTSLIQSLLDIQTVPVAMEMGTTL